MEHSVLIVDDNPSNLKLLRVLLVSEGYRVETAPSAEIALEWLKDSIPSLILTDLQMPGMDGLELIRRIKANPSMASVPVVAVTAYAMFGDEEKAKNAGCDAYVSKPVDTRTLPKLLSRLISAA